MHSLLPPEWFQLTPEAVSKLAPFQQVICPEFSVRGISLSMKREDLLDPYLGGNKFYKLWGYLKDHQASRSSLPIATFGGAYSNHLYATAAAGLSLGIPTVGIVRGERAETLSPTLMDVQALGMRLYFVTRSDYRTRYSAQYIQFLESKLGKCYWVPEGGSGPLGAVGCTALAKALEEEAATSGVKSVALACGTGTTLAGVRAGLADDTELLGVSVLKGEGVLENSTKDILSQISAKWTNLTIKYGFHCGGYAKLPQYLIEFIDRFEEKTGIPLDPVYTGKLMWGLSQLAKQGYWQEGTKLVVLHSGGLQGRRGYPDVFREINP